MKLSILILHYKTVAHTRSVLDSLFQLYKEQIEKNSIEILLVDNGSLDESIFLLKDIFSGYHGLHIFQNEKNFGFAKGNNVLARHAKGEYLLFLNSDVVIKDNGLLKMIEYLDEHEEVGVLGGKLVDSKGNIENTAGNFFEIPEVFFMLFFGERFNLTRWHSESVQKSDWVSGGLMMIRKELFIKEKGFDENFFMYMEDMELCYRLRNKTKIVYYPYLSAVHSKHGSSSRSFAIICIYKGIFYFYKKQKSDIEFIIIYWLLLMKAGFSITIGYIMNKPELVHTYKKALQFR